MPVWLNEHTPLWAVRLRQGRGRDDVVALVLTTQGLRRATVAAAEACPGTPYKADIVTRPLLAMDMGEIEPALDVAAHSVLPVPLRTHKIDLQAGGCVFVVTRRPQTAVLEFVRQTLPLDRIIRGHIVTSPVVIADWAAASEAAA